MRELADRVAIVTGAASGIGRSMSEHFLAERMSVVMADVEEDRLAAAADELKSQGDVLAVQTNVVDLASVEALAAATIDRFGTFHVVCNNAGVAGHLGMAWDTPQSDWDWVFNVNVWGVVNGIRTFVPTLIDQGEGHVVNTSSQHGWSADPSTAPYVASKHAVLGISAALREDLKVVGSGVGVTVLCPGPTDTMLGSSERNWPADLGREPELASDPYTQAVLDSWADTDVAAPQTAARDVVQAILTDRFVAATHPDALVKDAERRLEEARAAMR